MAEAIAAGAGNAECLIPAEQVTSDVLLEAAGYVFVCPENLGSVSGAMKEMFDRNYYALLNHVEGRAYATAIAAGSDGVGAQTQIDRIVTGWRLRRVIEPLIVNFSAQTPETILAPKSLPQDQAQKCRDLGEAFSAGLEMGIF